MKVKESCTSRVDVTKHFTVIYLSYNTPYLGRVYSGRRQEHLSSSKLGRVPIPLTSLVLILFALSLSFTSFPFTFPKIQLGSLDSALSWQGLGVGRRRTSMKAGKSCLVMIPIRLLNFSS